LQAGGFSVIALDMAGVPPWLARRIPLTSWFRFRRAVENTVTAFVLLEEKSYAQTCASLVIRTERAQVNWLAMQPYEVQAEQNVTTLLNEITFTAEVVRSRLLSAEERRPVASAFSAQPGWSIRNA
jgi:recombination protein RecA